MQFKYSATNEELLSTSKMIWNPRFVLKFDGNLAPSSGKILSLSATLPRPERSVNSDFHTFTFCYFNSHITCLSRVIIFPTNSLNDLLAKQKISVHVLSSHNCLRYEIQYQTFAKCAWRNINELIYDHLEPFDNCTPVTPLRATQKDWGGFDRPKYHNPESKFPSAHRVLR